MNSTFYDVLKIKKVTKLDQHCYVGGVGSKVTKPIFSNSAPGRYSGFQVTGMIEWSQKSRPKKLPRASSKTQKNPWTKN